MDTKDVEWLGVWHSIAEPPVASAARLAVVNCRRKWVEGGGRRLEKKHRPICSDRSSRPRLHTETPTWGAAGVH